MCSARAHGTTRTSFGQGNLPEARRVQASIDKPLNRERLHHKLLFPPTTRRTMRRLSQTGSSMNGLWP